MTLFGLPNIQYKLRGWVICLNFNVGDDNESKFTKDEIETVIMKLVARFM